MKTIEQNTVQFTRADYMEKRCSHREYYGQFVTESIRSSVRERFGADNLRAELRKDKNLNGIQLNIWDAMTGYPHHLMMAHALTASGDGPSLSSGVCILKEAARQVAESAD